MAHAEQGKELKMYYASFEPECSEAVRVWAKLLEQEDPSTEEVHGALLLGMHTEEVHWVCTEEIHWALLLGMHTLGMTEEVHCCWVWVCACRGPSKSERGNLGVPL